VQVTKPRAAVARSGTARSPCAVLAPADANHVVVGNRLTRSLLATGLPRGLQVALAVNRSFGVLVHKPYREATCVAARPVPTLIEPAHPIAGWTAAARPS
jgi:hypothetical protein